MRLIDADELYNKTRVLEEKAMAIINSMCVCNEKDIKKFDYWNAILNERTAFKYDIADAPTIESEQKKGKWNTFFSDSYKVHEIGVECSCCGYRTHERTTYCPNCGADMRGDNE